MIESATTVVVDFVLSKLARPAPRMRSVPPRSIEVARANPLCDSQKKSATKIAPSGGSLLCGRLSF